MADDDERALELADEEVLDARQLRPDLVNQVFESGLNDDYLGLTVVENVLEIGGHQTEVEGHENGPQSGCSEECFQHAMAILREDRDAIALRNSQGAHGVRPRINPLAKLSVGQAQVSTDDSFAVWIYAESALQEIVLI